MRAVADAELVPREALIGLVLMGSGVPFYWYWSKMQEPQRRKGAEE
jgi:hypothetical protein